MTTLPACSVYQSSSIVFLGHLIDVTPIPPNPPVEITYPDGTKRTTYMISSEGPTDQIRFHVLEVFKGDPGEEITVFGNGQEFREDGEYVVFASRYGTNLSVTGCSPSGPDDRSPSDAALVWLRAYPTAPPAGSIFGMGYGVPDIPAITVNLSDGKSITTSPGYDHRYTFNDLPPGTYTLTAVLPAGYTTSGKNTATVTVAAKGCAEVDWGIQHDSHIKGRVTDAAGNAAPHIAVSLVNAARNTRETMSVTDIDGNYELSGVSPGDYYVALDYLGPNNNDPYTPVYYATEAGDSTTPATIHLGPSESKENINLVRTPPLHPVSVHLHVINPDGTPVVKAHIAAMDPRTPHQFIGATADANGDADITLYEGRQYSLEADTSGYREPGCAGPVKFIAKEGLQLGTLTLDKSIQECRALEKRN
jgi:hypothetical protein